MSLLAACYPRNSSFSGKLGAITFKIPPKKVAGGNILFTGTASESRTTGKTSLKIHVNENTLVFTITGTMSGPAVGIILGLTWWPILAAS